MSMCICSFCNNFVDSDDFMDCWVVDYEWLPKVTNVIGKDVICETCLHDYEIEYDVLLDWEDEKTNLQQEEIK